MKQDQRTLKVFVREPPILEHCGQCGNGVVYAFMPEHPSNDFFEKIRMPRILCRSGRDPWREEPRMRAPDFAITERRVAYE